MLRFYAWDRGAEFDGTSFSIRPGAEVTVLDSGNGRRRIYSKLRDRPESNYP